MRDPKEISHSLTVSAISSKSQCTRLLLKITGITLLRDPTLENKAASLKQVHRMSQHQNKNKFSLEKI